MSYPSAPPPPPPGRPQWPVPPPVPGAFPPAKKRPSGWWFLVGGLLLVAAVVTAVLLFVRTLSSFMEVEARVPADNAPHAVEVGTDGDRFLWAREGGTADCVLVERGSGTPVHLEPVLGSFTRSGGSGEWQAVARFDPGSGDLEFTCLSAGGPAEIGPELRMGSFMGAIVLTVVLPLVLGLAGLVVLLVTGILWSSRPPRSAPGG